MKKWKYIIILLTLIQCREAYNVTPATNGEGVLVVEGVLNANGITRISVNRTTKLSDKRIAPEIGALLFIESSGGNIHQMNETSGGLYESENLVLDANQQYRLRINTLDNRQYGTDFKNYVITPVVDSLSWNEDAAGVNIFAHAHDNANSPRY